LEDELDARDAVARRYAVALDAVGIAAPVVRAENRSAWAQFTIRVDHREAVQAHLSNAGIPTVVHYPLPLSRQPAVADENARMPHSDAAAKSVLSLPMHPYLKPEEIDRIVRALAEAIATAKPIPA
jgi:UDP-2-acetamido-2-deoxy-ribo-hexuluronate aminotransferase